LKIFGKYNLDYTTGSERLYDKEKEYFPKVQTLICPFCHNINFLFSVEGLRGGSLLENSLVAPLGQILTFQKCKKVLDK